MKNKLLFLLTLLTWLSCQQDKLPSFLDDQLEAKLASHAPNNSLDHYILPESDDFSNIPQDPNNPLTAEKVALGKMLFFETGLAQDAMSSSAKSTYSCSTCHVPYAGFLPGCKQGIADGGLGYGHSGESRDQHPFYEEDELDVQGARPLSLINVAFHATNTSWSGQFGAHGLNEGTEDLWHEATEGNHLGLQGLETQNAEGLKLHRMLVNKEVLDEYGYTEMFDDVFSDFPEEERYTRLTASFAISAYLRIIFSNRAPFQRWLKGEKEAMSKPEKRGALLFYGKAGCYRCHKGPALSSVEFHALGVKDLHEAGGFNTDETDIRNFGRGGFTKRQEDLYKFKVPQLYNSKDFNFYFHGSSKTSLEEVVEYFNNAVPENDRVDESQISPLFHPLRMTEDEKQDLVSFLENGIYDPNLNRYMPHEVLSGNCFPNNDLISKVELGCGD